MIAIYRYRGKYDPRRDFNVAINLDAIKEWHPALIRSYILREFEASNLVREDFEIKRIDYVDDKA